MAKRPAKTEALTIRLDPKTRFMLEFIARLRGQPLTTVVERAIADSADAASVPGAAGFGEPEAQTWKDFWDVSDGIRAIKIASERELRPTYEEEKRLAFVKKHSEFFYSVPRSQSGFRVGCINVLWPRIDEFISLDDESLTKDHWAAGKAMAQVLREADLKPPVWPPVAPKAEPASVPGGMDDDPPF